jgi:hypothetical protein
MTHTQLISSVASITGESLSTVRALGFELLTEVDNQLEPEDLRLVVDCPFCRKPVPYPNDALKNSLRLAECSNCDVEFPFAEDEVYAAGTIEVSSSTECHRTNPRLTFVA